MRKGAALEFKKPSHTEASKLEAMTRNHGAQSIRTDQALRHPEYPGGPSTVQRSATIGPETRQDSHSTAETSKDTEGCMYPNTCSTFTNILSWGGRRGKEMSSPPNGNSK